MPVCAKGGHFYYSQYMQCCAAVLLYLKRYKLQCDCGNVFKHAKITRWHHCNADNFKTLKANYMLIT